MNLIKCFLLISIFCFSGHLSAQDDIFRIKNVPIKISGDGLAGYVDFRARAACMGEPRIQLAVDRVVIEGITYEGSYYRLNDIEDYSSSVEVSGGLVYLKGSISYRLGIGSHHWNIQPGSIGVKLQGFMDWITIEEGQAPHKMSCPEWTAHFKNDIIPFIEQHKLEIYREDVLGDGLFSKLTSSIEAEKTARENLEKLQSRYYKIMEGGSVELAELLQKIESYDWPETGRGFRGKVSYDAAELEEDVKYALEQAKEQEERESAQAKDDVNAKRSVSGSSGSSVTVFKRQDSKKDEEKKEIKEKEAPYEAGSNKKEESLPPNKHIAAEVERMSQFNKAMTDARAAEARGDKAAALRAFEKAQMYNATAENQQKINMYRGEIAFSAFGKALADAFIGDPDKQLNKWIEQGKREKAIRNAMVVEHTKEWFNLRKDLLIYNLKFLYLLTGDESLVDENKTYDEYLTLPEVKYLQDDELKNSLSKQMAAATKQPAHIRSDSIYVFVYQVETQNTFISPFDNRMSNAMRNKLPGESFTKAELRKLMPLPEMVIKSTNIVAFPTEALLSAAKEKDFDINKKIFEWLQPANYNSSSRENIPLLVAADNREYAEQLKKNLSDASASNIKAESVKTNVNLFNVPNGGIAGGLIRAGGNVKKKGDFYMHTPLHNAAKYGKAEVVRVLLEYGADVNSTDNSGATALLNAAANGQYEIVQILLDADADVNLDGKYYGAYGPFTPLSAAEEYNHTKVADLLIKHGGSVELGRAKKIKQLEEVTQIDYKKKERLMKKSLAIVKRRPARKIKKLKTEAYECLLFKDFDQDDEENKGMFGTRYWTKNGRAHLEQPSNRMDGSFGWGFSSASQDFYLGFDLEYESGGVVGGGGIQLENGDSEFVEFVFQAGKRRDGFLGLLIGYKGRNEEKYKVLLPWEKNKYVKTGVNRIEIIGRGHNLFLYINNKFSYEVSLDFSDFKKVLMVISPGVHYSYDNVVLLALKPNINEIWNRHIKLNNLAWRYYKNAYQVSSLKEAKKWVEQSIKLNEDNYNTGTYAAILYRLGYYKKALRHIKNSIKLAKEKNTSHEFADYLIVQITDQLKN